MKNTFSTITFIFLALAVSGQTLKTNISDKVGYVSAVVQMPDSFYYSIVVTSKTVVNKFDRGLHLVSTLNLNNPKEFGSQARTEGFVHTNRYVYIRTESLDHKTHNGSTLFTKFSPITGFDGPSVEIKGITYKAGFSMDNDVQSVTLSPDNKILAGISAPSWQEPKGNQHMVIKVFNEDLELLWEKDQEFPYEGADTRIMSARVDNNGTVIMIASVIDRKSFNNKKQRVKAFIVTKNELKEFEINLHPDKFLNNGVVIIRNDGSAGLFGLYNKQRISEYCHGFCAAKFDYLSGKMGEMEYTPFSPKLLQSFSKNQIDVDSTKLGICGFKYLPSGNIIIATQVSKTVDFAKGGSVTGFGDKLIVEFDENMHVKFNTIVQSSFNEYSSGYIGELSGESFLVFRNGKSSTKTLLEAVIVSDKGDLKSCGRVFPDADMLSIWFNTIEDAGQNKLIAPLWPLNGGAKKFVTLEVTP